MAVIGVDASTTAVKALAFASDGRVLASGRASYPTNSPAPGHHEQDAEAWWRAFASAVRECLSGLGAPPEAIAVTHQRETFVLTGPDGAPVRPAILWLDERARAQVAELSGLLGRERIRDLTGKPPDPTPALYALRWLRTHEPEALAGAAMLHDAGGYLAWRLTGRHATAAPSADPLGMVDLASGRFADVLVEAAGLRADQLPELVPTGGTMGRVGADAASATGLPEGLPVVAAAGDGQSTGLGLGTARAGSAYLSLGSGVVLGVHADRLATSDTYRTLLSPTGQGYALETVIRSGMTLVDWVVRLVGGGSATALKDLTAAAADVPPGAGGLTAQPYWAGVMNPHWDPDARGALVGLDLSHGPAHVMRAVLEGLAMEQALAARAIEAEGGVAVDGVVAAGGGTRSAPLLGIMAACLNRPIGVSAVGEAAALGAGVAAVVGAGLHADFDDAAAAMTGALERTVEPDPALVDAYASLIERYAALHPALARFYSA